MVRSRKTGPPDLPAPDPARPGFLSFLIPGRLETRTGGYEYDRRMVGGLRARGWSVEIRELDASFPRPVPAALAHAADVLSAFPDEATIVVDGLAFGAMPNEVAREAHRLRFVALVHLPLAAAIGLDPDSAGVLEANERRALRSAAAVVATGAGTVGMLQDYGVPADRIDLVEPGTERGPLSRGSRGETLEFLSVATLNAGKGHVALVEALAGIGRSDWHVTCAGSLERDPATVERVRALLHEHALVDRVSLVGELNEAELAACYDRADVFVLPTLSETYGMAVAEALGHGLPVISTNTGAIPQLVGDEAGIILARGDVEALRGALLLVMTDRSVLRRFALGARRVRDRLPTWDDAVDKMATVLERVASDG